MGIDEVEQWLALLDRPAIEMIDHLVRNEEAFATGVGMGDHHRVHRASHARQLFLGGRLAPVENTRRSEEHTSDFKSLMRISYAVVFLYNTTPQMCHILHNN